MSYVNGPGVVVLVDQVEQWYTNKDLFEMVQALKDELAETRQELATTRDSIHRYNNLREELTELNQRLTTVEAQAEARAGVGQAIREWGGWLVAMIGIAVSLWSL